MDCIMKKPRSAYGKLLAFHLVESVTSSFKLL